MPAREKRSTGYLPGLDGLRAIAIVGVLMTHDEPWSLAGHSNAVWHGFGGWGVQLFFAISGVLICWRLLEDEERRGSLRLRAFYIRRFFRIQPAAWVYLLVIAALTLLRILPSRWMFWFSAVFSFTNYVVLENTPAGAGAFVGHFWTLSVEEHFYLLISLLFLVPKRHRAIVLGAFLVLLTVVQDLGERHGYLNASTDRQTWWVVQELLTPALLAMLVRRSRVRTWVEQYAQPWRAFVATFLLMSARLAWNHRGSLSYFMSTLTPLGFLGSASRTLFFGFGLIVIAVMLHRHSWTTRLLEWAPLRYVGRLSYSLYLWHILFFIPFQLPDQVHSPLLLLLASRPWRYVATAVCACLSYYLVEKPFIRLGHRLAPPATEGHADLASNSQSHAAELSPATAP